MASVRKWLRSKFPSREQPPADGSCHFLRLPSEIRNLVYTYALSQPDHLLRYTENGHSRGQVIRCGYALTAMSPPDDAEDANAIKTPNKSQHIEANQLQYVNR
ncbi:hypothetical protein BDV95DRAFT_600466 [Massariosphaeria phaeospora]|uniref:Uncharacterized protein n=1 Tax=Massariosphaeria phaeospora TaxID=100035 RepID=A0A7C8IQN9_9PLEO|nr:hypothetical protein BDV95DRAFT_600466 [Massariosphaeria phaeospora]